MQNAGNPAGIYFQYICDELKCVSRGGYYDLQNYLKPKYAFEAFVVSRVDAEETLAAVGDLSKAYEEQILWS